MPTAAWPGTRTAPGTVSAVPASTPLGKGSPEFTAFQHAVPQTYRVNGRRRFVWTEDFSVAGWEKNKKKKTYVLRANAC